MIKLLSTIFISLVLLNGCTSSLQKNYAVPAMPADNDAFLDSLQRRAFLYFVHEVNPKNGLVKDRSTATSPASIAACGFALPSWAIGAERGWISRRYAAQLTFSALKFFLESEQSQDTLATGYQGFYYHFLDMKTGQRFWRSELSTVDTAWLLAGIRFAMKYYDKTDTLETNIREMGEMLTSRVNWDFMTMPDTGHYASSVSMGWFPERGLHPMGWVGYNEAQTLYILAAGGGYSNAAKAYQRWLSAYEWNEPYPGLAHAVFPPLFGHQWTQLFLNLKGMQDAYMQTKGIDYFENSRRAALTQQCYAVQNPKGWVGYDSLIWGITACDGPGSTYNRSGKVFHGYAGRGTSGPAMVFFDDGTIAPTGSIASLAFAPEIVFPTMRALYDRYAAKGLWKKYGFVDAFNPTVGWYDDEYVGIDQGPIVIAIENYRSGLVHKLMMQDELILRGLDALGFK
jgi:hypothetical protein